MRLKLTFLSLFAITLASFSTTYAQSSSATYAVTFGIKQEGGGDCAGKGVCECSPTSNPSAGSINVLFHVSSDQTVLSLSFSLADLRNNQPSQVSYFQSGSYIFGATFPLSDAMFSSLGLSVNAAITSSCNSTVTINGDVVTDYITLVTN